MRIAVSGTHRAGKSTLIEELAQRLPKHRVVDEPYHLMEEEGYEFAHPPSLADFEAQLERSLNELRDDRADVLFDRCPLDFLAYATVHPDGEELDIDEWLPRVRAALQSLDLILFVPLEAPERIAFTPESDEDDDVRTTVDEELRDILLDDCFDLDLGLDILEVGGSVEERASAALRRIQKLRRAGAARNSP